MTEYQEIQMDMLAETVLHGFAEGGVKLVLRNSDTWEYTLPAPLNEHKQMVLDIKGWALEQSYVDEEGIYIQTAFGDEENSKHFSFDDVLNVVTFDGVLLYQKIMSFDQPAKRVEPKMEATGKAYIQDEDSEARVYSMRKLMEKNAHLAKRNKK
jgi:hypothetical protein